MSETMQPGNSRNEVLEKNIIIYFTFFFLGDQDLAAIFKMQLGAILPLKYQIKECEVK